MLFTVYNDVVTFEFTLFGQLLNKKNQYSEQIVYLLKISFLIVCSRNKDLVDLWFPTVSLTIDTIYAHDSSNI